MSDGSTARRWAKALDELAVESGRPEAVLADLSSVASVLVGEGEALRHALSLYLKEGRLTVVDKWDPTDFKTKAVASTITRDFSRSSPSR